MSTETPKTTCAGCGAEMTLEVKEYTVSDVAGNFIERFIPRYCRACTESCRADLCLQPTGGR